MSAGTERGRWRETGMKGERKGKTATDNEERKFKNQCLIKRCIDIGGGHTAWHDNYNL